MLTLQKWTTLQRAAAVTALLLLLVLGWAYRRQPAAPQYQTAVVERQPLTRMIMASGELDAVNSVEVGTQISGQLQQLRVQVGDQVEPGQLLAILDPFPAENQVAIEQTKLQIAQTEQRIAVANLKQAQLKQQRLVRLVRSQAAKPEALEEATHQLILQQAACDKRAATLEKNRLRLEKKQRDLQQTRITAPLAASVVAITVRVGQTVVSSQTAATLLVLADLRRMRVRALISEADIIQLTPGLVAEFTLLGDHQRRFRGTILTLEGLAEKIDNALFYPVLFEVDNPDGRLRLGMTAQVSIVLEQLNDALVIPVAALGNPLANGRHTVQILVAGKPQQRQVTVGARNELMVQITEGLTVGETVIIAETLARAD